jgi:hypothetical protein
MSNEYFERQMKFILEQQAKFAENLEKQREREASYRAERQEWDAQVNSRLDRVDRQIEELLRSMSILRDALIGLTHHTERHQREMADWIERGKQMDARLNALILVVERHISGHQ